MEQTLKSRAFLIGKITLQNLQLRLPSPQSSTLAIRGFSSRAVIECDGDASGGPHTDSSSAFMPRPPAAKIVIEFQFLN